jgi:hypothetical protein
MCLDAVMSEHTSVIMTISVWIVFPTIGLQVLYDSQDEAYLCIETLQTSAEHECSLCSIWVFARDLDLSDFGRHLRTSQPLL